MSWKRYDSQDQEELKTRYEEESEYEWTEQKAGQREAVIHSGKGYNDHMFSTVKMHCAFCGKEMYADITSYNLGLKYCSGHCASHAGSKAVSDRNRELRDKTCPVCGKEFTAVRRDAKYCSKACKQMAYRKGIKAEEAPTITPEPEREAPRSKEITVGNVKLHCLEIDGEWWYLAATVASSLRLPLSEQSIKEYVMDGDLKQVVYSENNEKVYDYINTAALISLLLACRLPEAKAFREAVVSKALMRPGKSGSPPEWTETDKQLADPEYPLRVLMQIIETREKRIIDRES